MALLRLRTELRPVFLEGYRTTTVTPSSDLDLLQVVMRYHLLTGAVRVWEAYTRTGNPDRLAKVLAYAGYFFGSLPIIRDNLMLAIMIIILLSITPGIVEYVRHQRRPT